MSGFKSKIFSIFTSVAVPTISFLFFFEISQYDVAPTIFPAIFKLSSSFVIDGANETILIPFSMTSLFLSEELLHEITEIIAIINKDILFMSIINKFRKSVFSYLPIPVNQDSGEDL